MTPPRQSKLKTILANFYMKCVPPTEENRPSKLINEAEADLQKYMLSSFLELIGEDEEVPKDIWADPRPEKVRARNELRNQLRQAARKQYGGKDE